MEVNFTISATSRTFLFVDFFSLGIFLFNPSTVELDLTRAQSVDIKPHFARNNLIVGLLVGPGLGAGVGLLVGPGLGAGVQQLQQFPPQLPNCPDEELELEVQKMKNCLQQQIPVVGIRECRLH
ncbi:hypothetical protein F8388_026006 [Cannabis sativa]|uniref:Uncharacterized protein n=1 Tax=Cannabis sativa TaxID=3483 RepID=A0A7J6EC35_CANSA|nr:hypothetical protein F8388_026006 [Cannabis sativa]